jgi:polyhydroxyalkanoate synthase
MALPNWNLLSTVDRLRRLMGERLDTAGLGPLETPFDYVYCESGMSLRRNNAQYTSSGPVLLIVPAPIKAGYIWDAMPSLSMVQRCLKCDCRVYLVEWTRPNSRGPDLGLDDYTDRLLVKCLNAIQAETGNQSVFLAGHSL